MVEPIKFTWTLEGIIAVWARGRDLPVNKGDVEQLCEVIYSVGLQLGQAMDKRACLGCRSGSTSHTCREQMLVKLVEAHRQHANGMGDCICTYCIMYREEQV